MSTLPDLDARVRAMTDHGSTLLVEAGAGSGKTALIAGRVVCLLAAGVAPRAIAAITFSELAAGELFARICEYLDRLLAGEVPREIDPAFPGGPTAAQRDCVARAREAIGELTATTIHGFCQGLITPYPVEADLDPGARVMDESEAQLAWEDLFRQFLRRRLDAEEPRGALAAYVLAVEPAAAERELRQMAGFLRRHRTARPPPAPGLPGGAGAFADAVDAFGAWLRAQRVEEASSVELARELETLAQDYRARLAGSPPDPVALMTLATQPPACSALTQKLGWRRWGRKGAWQKAAASAGASKAEGGRVSDQGAALYDAAGKAWQALHATLSAHAFAGLAGELGELLADYARYKREAARLDFDDLLLEARALLRRDEAVRAALARRYRAVLVDEFQDTDPVQAEILWLLCGEGEPGAPWAQRALRPGALFCVGDPKQAIYRFRGADVDTYVRARDAIRAQHPENVLSVTANFRTVAPILQWVNARFAAPLGAAGQPGFEALAATRDAPCEPPRMVALDVELAEDEPNADRIREQEAAAVAALCRSLIGGEPPASRPGGAPMRPGDIALLAPGGTELWRYERALEEAGIPVASQAGKGFFRRQEIQDLIALARAVSDPRDTLALGALLRGPLVGLTEQELLDIAVALPRADGARGPGRLTLATDADAIADGRAREVLRVLQGLARRARSTTPFELLCEAVEALRVRPMLAARHPRGAERALANVDQLLELARPYAARGLRSFASAMQARWEDAESQVEGRPDAEEHAVQLITMHSAKGLEWPVVIPINTVTALRNPSGILHDREHDTLRGALGPVPDPRYRALLAREVEQASHERVRLLYVTCTRAKDLLVLPRVAAAKLPWLELLDLDTASLPALALAARAAAPAGAGTEAAASAQDRAAFEAEAARIACATRVIERRRPSRHERDDAAIAAQQALAAAFVDAPEPAPAIEGGPGRGTLLHKLIEEVLTGEVEEGAETLAARAAELAAQLGLPVSESPDRAGAVSPQEAAQTVRATLALPEVAALRARLLPELAVRSAQPGASASHEIVISGTADAVALDARGGIDAVVDWKSDVAPDRARRERYRAQVRDYLEACGARRGLVVYMTLRQVDQIDCKEGAER